MRRDGTTGTLIASSRGATSRDTPDYPSRVTEIGLFPLAIVLVPDEQIPLHIFEPRYKELIGECLEREVTFGLVLADDDGMREVGTHAAVIEVLERFADGRLNIVAEGRARFRILRETSGRSFATAEVAAVVDAEEERPSDDDVRRCHDAYLRVVEAADAEPDELDLQSGNIAFQIAARLDLGAPSKQRLLELDSERDRLALLEPLLAEAAEALERGRAISQRAMTNGHVERP
jgi:ATP-dependent Lon protease